MPDKEMLRSQGDALRGNEVRFLHFAASFFRRIGLAVVLFGYDTGVIFFPGRCSFFYQARIFLAFYSLQPRRLLSLAFYFWE